MALICCTLHQPFEQTKRNNHNHYDHCRGHHHHYHHRANVRIDAHTTFCYRLSVDTLLSSGAILRHECAGSVKVDTTTLCCIWWALRSCMCGGTTLYNRQAFNQCQPPRCSIVGRCSAGPWSQPVACQQPRSQRSALCRSYSGSISTATWSFDAHAQGS
jgi:hypothetical protein